MEPPTFKCHKCGAGTIVEPPDNPAVCENCCEDHDYEYCREERTYYCNHCGAEPPDDWYFADDDVPITFSTGRKPEELGTPLSELSTKPGTKGYANFVKIARSWGHD